MNGFHEEEKEMENTFRVITKKENCIMLIVSIAGRIASVVSLWNVSFFA
jgi:hypothetical protein